MVFKEFLQMLSVLGLHPKIPNDASNDWAITRIFLRARGSLRPKRVSELGVCRVSF